MGRALLALVFCFALKSVFAYERDPQNTLLTLAVNHINLANDAKATVAPKGKLRERQCSGLKTVSSSEEVTSLIPKLDDNKVVIRATEDGSFLVRLSFVDMMTLVMNAQVAFINSTGVVEGTCEGKTDVVCVFTRMFNSLCSSDADSSLAREAFLRQMFLYKRFEKHPRQSSDINIRQPRSVDDLYSLTEWMAIASIMRGERPAKQLTPEELAEANRSLFDPVTDNWRLLAEVVPTSDGKPLTKAEGFAEAVLGEVKGLNFASLVAPDNVLSPMKIVSRSRRGLEHPPFHTIGQYSANGREQIPAVNYYSRHFLETYGCLTGRSDAFYQSVKRFGDELWLSHEEAKHAAYLVCKRKQPSFETFRGIDFIRIGEIITTGMGLDEAKRRVRVAFGEPGLAVRQFSDNFPLDPANRSYPGIDDDDYRPNMWVDNVTFPEFHTC